MAVEIPLLKLLPCSLRWGNLNVHFQGDDSMKRTSLKYHSCNTCLFLSGNPPYCTASREKHPIKELDLYKRPYWCPLIRGKDDVALCRSVPFGSL